MYQMKFMRYHPSATHVGYGYGYLYS